MPDFSLFQNKMSAAGMDGAVIKAFRRNYEALLRNGSGMIPESTITPRRTSCRWRASRQRRSRPLPARPNRRDQAQRGTWHGHGPPGPKSLLTVADGLNFLDLIVRQILELRRKSGTAVRLLLMNSFSTSADTLAYLAKYRGEGLADASGIEVDAEPRSQDRRPDPSDPSSGQPIRNSSGARPVTAIFIPRWREAVGLTAFSRRGPLRLRLQFR